MLVVALIAAAFLNARSLQREAQISEPGLSRDVRLAVTDTLVGISSTVGLDLPRRGLQAAIGRSGVDDVDDGPIDFSASASGDAEPTQQAPQAPREPVKPVFDPDRPMRIWSAGDSLAIVPGQALVRIAASRRALQSASPPDGQLASGLERPDVFNWFDHIPAEVDRLKPNLVVLSFGGNDDHGYMTGVPDVGVINGFGTPAWNREYRRRVGGLMSELAAKGVLQVWVLPPVTRDADQSARYRAIGDLIEQEALTRPARVRVVDAYELLAGPGGTYADYAEKANGEFVRTRAPDGVHMDPAGGDIVARAVVDAAGEMADIRHRSAPPTIDGRPIAGPPAPGA